MGLGRAWLQSLVGAVLLVITPATAQAISAIVGLSLDNNTVTEGDSALVCLELFQKSLIAGAASVTLITDKAEAGSTLTAGADYAPLKEEFLLTPTSPSQQCVMLQTHRDHAVEDTEIVAIALVNNSGVDVGPPLHLSIIPAQDKLVVDFVEMSYTVTEGGGPLYMYVELIEGAIERAFPSTVEVEFTTLDLSTEGSDDYTIPASVVFSAEDTAGSVKAVEFTVQDDLRVEGPETMHVVIVTDSRIMNPVTTSSKGVAAVTLLDNDKASVELVSPAVATVVEDDDHGNGSRVELCVELVVEPVLAIDRAVVVLFDTEDVTTDSSDYRLGETVLTFQPDSASSTLCTALTTAPDGGEESNETVVVHVVPVAPDTTPGGEQRSLTVNILNNDVNCPAIPTPPYPSLIVTSGGLTEGATVIYSCAPGYNLNGGAQQVCVDGIWTGRKPTCTALNCGEPPLLENGEFSLANTTVNSTAVYFCEEGYRESLGLGMSNEIQCMPDGTWSQLNLECVALGSSGRESDGLGGGGIAAIVIGVLLIVATVVGVVSLLGTLCYFYSTTGVKRSGKYVVDNSDIEDPQPMKSSKPLSLTDFEDENVFEEDTFVTSSSLTDV